MSTLSARKLENVEVFQPALPARPFVKWVGGKSKLCAQLIARLPQGVERMRHVEPFAGGAALFFTRSPDSALLMDINRSLVQTYLAVRDHLEGVIQQLQALARAHSVDHYYEVRARYNHEPRLTIALKAAMFIYLNKTCFNGLHRVNRKGEFNVPAGRYNNPTILDAESLRSASYRLQNTELQEGSYMALLEKAKPGDFIYFDPPYEPVSATSNFTAYTAGGFNSSEQEQLSQVFRILDRRGCKLMLSNSDTETIRNLYSAYHIDQVFAPRMVNCKPNNRGAVAELLIRNYR